MDVVKEIEKVETDRSDRPLEEIVMKKVQIIEEASDQTKAEAKTGK
jgi:hypothetical protein